MKVRDIIAGLTQLDPMTELEVIGPDGRDHDKLAAFGQINLPDMPVAKDSLWKSAPYMQRQPS